jgi:UDP-N-acetylmuramyl pentapeptide phosphotransferase/UDP-N-acetylglucosamine-1-phosphate transferase
MTLGSLGLPALLAFAGTATVLALALSRGKRVLPVDRPNERSLHSTPIPRIGGMAMMAVLVPVALATVPGAAAWVLPMAVLAVVSGIDDFRGLPVAVRFGAQGLVAAYAVGLALTGLPWWVFTLAWLATVWTTNLYNFMDGSDGLAGGMAVFGFGSFAIAGWQAGDPMLAASCVAVAASAAGFLLFNFNPARVFMGDAGSVPLGFLAALFGAIGWRAGYWDLVFPVLVFAPFVVDATVTLMHRLMRGERVWQAHRSHYYQRLIQLGAGHRRTALLEYTLMASMAAAALAGRATGHTTAAAAASAAVLVALGAAIDVRWARRQAKAAR